MPKATEYHCGWDRWITRNTLRGVSKNKIREVLLRNGFDSVFIDQKITEILTNPIYQAAQECANRHHKLASLLTTISYLQEEIESEESVEQIVDLDPTDFYSKYVRANKPVLAKGLILSWDAITKWNGLFFLEKMGNITIQMSENREADPRFEDNFKKHTTSVLLSDYIDRVEKNIGNDFYICAKHNFLANEKAYVLLNDFEYPNGFLDDSVPKSKASLWFGPKGTWTPFHHDASNILFCQVLGTKILYLVAPIHIPRLYNDRTCFSDVDPRKINLEQFPLMKGVPVKKITVEPGDALLIPVGWWHCVEALTTSISLSLSNFLLPRHANVWSWR
jgi:hypothetical protein